MKTLTLCISILLALNYSGAVAQCISYSHGLTDVTCSDTIGSIAFNSISGGNGSYYNCLVSDEHAGTLSYVSNSDWQTTSGTWAGGYAGVRGTSGLNPTKVYDINLLEEGIPMEVLDGDPIIRFGIQVTRIRYYSGSKANIYIQGFNASGTQIYYNAQSYQAINSVINHIRLSGTQSGLRRVRITIQSGIVSGSNLVGNSTYAPIFRYPSLRILDAETGTHYVPQGNFTTAVVQQNSSTSCLSNYGSATISLDQTGSSIELDSNIGDINMCFKETDTLRASSILGNYASLSLDGVNDYVDIGDEAYQFHETSRSFFTWINSSSSSSQVIYGINSNSGGNINSLYLNSSGYLSMYFVNSGVSGNTAINDGNWHHVGYTYNAATDTFRVYLDGNLHFTTYDTTSARYSHRHSIGQEFDGASASEFFDGLIGPTTWWNEVLSLPEIEQIRFAPPLATHPKFSNLIGNYTFNTQCNMAYLHNSAGRHGRFMEGTTQHVGPSFSFNSSDTIPGYEYGLDQPLVNWYLDGVLVATSDSLVVQQNDSLDHQLTLNYFYQGSSVAWDTVELYYSGGYLNLPDELFLCAPDSSSYSALSGKDAYSWSTGDTTQEIIVSQAANIGLTITENGCVFSDSMELIQKAVQLHIDLNSDTQACVNSEYIFGHPNVIQAALYDGVDDASAVEGLADSIAGTSFSLSFWFKNLGECLVSSHFCYGNSSYPCPAWRTSGYIPATDCIDRKWISVENSNDSTHFLMRLNPDEQWEFSNGQDVISTPVTSYSVWNHLAVVYDDINSQLSYYLDGELIGSDTLAITIQSGDIFKIGSGLNAALAELSIWSIALDSSSIAELHQNSPDSSFTYYSSLTAFYDFSEECASMNEFRDASSNNLDGVHVDGSLNQRGNELMTQVEIEGYDPSSKYEYLWWSTELGILSNEDSLTFTPEVSDTVILVMTDFSVYVTDTVRIGVLGVNIDLGADTAYCEEDGPLTVQLSTSPGYYLWEDGSTNALRSLSQTGIYWAQVTAPNGCIDSDTMELVLYGTPEVSISGNPGLCPGDTGSLSVDSGFSSYWWSTGDSTINIILDSGGLYQIQIADSNGCGSSDSVFVESWPASATDLGNDTAICSENAPIQILGGNGGSFWWNTGSTGNLIQVFNSGQYWLERVNEYGCTSSDTINIAIQEDPEISILGMDHLCGDDTTLLEAVSNGSVLWNTGDTTNFVLISDSGRYFVTATSSIGCTSMDSIDISKSSNPIVDLGEIKNLCYGDQEIIYPVFDSSTTGISTYLWNDGSILPVFVFQAGQSDSAVTVRLSVSDIFGCLGSDSVKVEVSNCLGIGDLIAESRINIFPNPIGNSLHVHSETAVMSYRLIDASGRTVMDHFADGASDFVIETRQLSSGIYSLLIQSGSSVHTFHVVKP